MALDPVSAVADLVGNVIDRIWPDATEAAKAKLALAQLQANGQLAILTAQNDLLKGQLQVDAAEVASASFWVAGWRPFVGWGCGAAVMFQFVGAPLITWVATLAGKPIPFPTLDTGTLMTLLFAMLGVGGMRTAEKISGVARGAH